MSGTSTELCSTGHPWMWLQAVAALTLLQVQPWTRAGAAGDIRDGCPRRPPSRSGREMELTPTPGPRPSLPCHCPGKGKDGGALQRDGELEQQMPWWVQSPEHWELFHSQPRETKGC